MTRLSPHPHCRPCDEPMVPHQVAAKTQDRAAIVFWRCPECGDTTDHVLLCEPVEREAA